MSRIYVSAVTTGNPAPGGFGLVLYQGKVLLSERQQSLPRTSPLLASALACREAVKDAPAGESSLVYTDNVKLLQLLTSGGQVRHPELRGYLSEIRTLIHQRRLDIHWKEGRPTRDPEMREATRLARLALDNAWQTHNSPQCPRCGDQMRVTDTPCGRQWLCLNENCQAKLDTYQLGVE